MFRVTPLTEARPSPFSFWGFLVWESYGGAFLRPSTALGVSPVSCPLRVPRRNREGWALPLKSASPAQSAQSSDNKNIKDSSLF